MMTRNKLFAVTGLAAALAFSGWSALAQSGTLAPPGPPPPPEGDMMFFSTEGPGPGGPAEGIVVMGFEGGFEGKTVTGAPFTATTSVQTSQTLADGNQIQHTSTGTLARDSQGRTRRDMTLPAIGPWAASGKPAPQVSTINDPVAGVHYVLEADKKVARQFSGKGHGHGGRHHGGPGGPGGAASPDAASPRRNQANVVTASLGTQTINGVSATGTRITRTIPEGAMGNTKPIVITVERWYSADLQTVVMTKRSDPRTGEFVMQLTNIQRSEPDASLFQVPADYTIEKGRPHVKGAWAKPLGD